MTVKQILEESSRRILRRDAETLLLHVAGKDRAWLLAHPEAELSQDEAGQIADLVSRREKNEPIQYLTGRQEFFGLDLRVSPDVLIPRPETELLIEAVLAWVEDSTAQSEAAHARPAEPRLVDVGTGSGAVAAALAKALPHADVWAIDLSGAALAIAKGNADRLGLSGRIRFEQSDLLNDLRPEHSGEPPFDVVVSNPPYVSALDAPSMQPEVRDFEPHLALFAGEDGLAVYRRLIPQARQVLRRGGLLAMEFGFGQKDALAQLLGEWREVRFLDDYAGIPRVVLAERS